VTLDIPESFKATIQRSKSQCDITYQHQKRYWSSDQILWDKLGENCLRAGRNTLQAFKVIRSNTEIAITTPRIARLRSHLVQTLSRHRRYAANVQGQTPRLKSHRKVMHQQQKRYNTAVDRFSDFKLFNN